MEEKVRFDYFFQCFRKAFNGLGENSIEKHFGRDAMAKLTRDYDIYAIFPLGEKRIELFDFALVLMGSEYCKLTNTEIEPKIGEPFVYIEEILGTISKPIYPSKLPDNKKVSYQESFLYSLEMICKDYFLFLEKGKVTLSSSLNPEFHDKYLQITLDAYNQMIECEAVNMDMTESTETLLRVLKLEKENKIGPVENVVHRFRKDVY